MRRDLGVFILAACPVFAQPAPAKLVTLDIAAMGAHGQAIPDLRSSEIEIFDNKRAQSIVYWRSNERRPNTPHVTVVLFSLEKSGIKSAAWNEAVSAMRRFEASDYFYFYAVTDHGVLLPVHALPKPDADSPPENAPWMDQRLPQFESASNLQQPPWDMEYSPHSGASLTYAQYATLNYAQDIATRLAAFPGRKSLVCIGCLLFNASSWHANNPEASQAALATELHELAGAFHQARVAVYPVGGQRRIFLASQVGESVNLIRIDQIDAFARVTGGRAYAHGEIEQAITQAVNDGRSSYRIGYLPPPGNWDGKTHQIKIVSTRAGVRALAPSWYFADLLEDVVREWKPAIPDFIITSPLDQSDIAVSISQPEKAANTVRIRVHVDAADLLLLPHDGRYSGDLTLQALCYTSEGRRLACTEPLHFKLDLSQRERETAMRGGLWFPLSLPAGEVSTKIRVVIYDASSGAAGSSTLLIQETH
jgi:VWFA-related protein